MGRLQKEISKRGAEGAEKTEGRPVAETRHNAARRDRKKRTEILQRTENGEIFANREKKSRRTHRAYTFQL